MEIRQSRNKAKQKSSPDSEMKLTYQLEEINEEDIQEASIDLLDEDLELSDDEMFTESD